MAQIRSIAGALFIVTLVLVAPSVFSGEIADSVSTVVGKVAECNKGCEGKGTPADIDVCKKKCSLSENYGYATIGLGACVKKCDKMKADQDTIKTCGDECNGKYEARLAQIKEGKNL